MNFYVFKNQAIHVMYFIAISVVRCCTLFLLTTYIYFQALCGLGQCLRALSLHQSADAATHWHVNDMVNNTLLKFFIINVQWNHLWGWEYLIFSGWSLAYACIIHSWWLPSKFTRGFGSLKIELVHIPVLNLAKTVPSSCFSKA